MTQEVQVLEEIAANGPPWAAERASIALQLLYDFQSGAIDSSEYQEIMEDLVRADQLDSEADDLETKTALVSAVYVVAQIA
jgi:hypothetical protein